MPEPIIISHWYTLLEGLQLSSQQFYLSLQVAIEKRQVPDQRMSKLELSEGGILSSRREYFRIRRKDLIFDVCAAPFGNSFFVSWWLVEEPKGCLSFIGSIPLIGLLFRWLIKPLTYYKIDTAFMFQQSVHNAVLEVIDETTKAQGIRALSELERKPILREMFQR